MLICCQDVTCCCFLQSEHVSGPPSQFYGTELLRVCVIKRSVAVVYRTAVRYGLLSCSNHDWWCLPCDMTAYCCMTDLQHRYTYDSTYCSVMLRHWAIGSRRFDRTCHLPIRALLDAFIGFNAEKCSMFIYRDAKSSNSSNQVCVCVTVVIYWTLTILKQQKTSCFILYCPILLSYLPCSYFSFSFAESLHICGQN